MSIRREIVARRIGRGASTLWSLPLRRLFVILLLKGIVILPAQAQRFFPVLNPYEFRTPGERVERLQIGSYGTRWDLAPYHIAYRHGLTAYPKVDLSILATTEYFVSRRLSVGGWQNQISASLYRRPRAEYPELPKPPQRLGQFDASYWDLHATYYAPSPWGQWWAFQIGFSAVSSSSRLFNTVGHVIPPPAAGTLRSPNLWITRTQHVGGRSVKRHRHLIFLFGSLGYHTSGQFGHATNLMFGGAVDLSGQFSLSSSVWLNDFDDLAVRTTVGLVGRF
jgi:hypothetical protein